MIGWTLVAIALVGTILNIRRNRYGFTFWFMSNVGLVWLNIGIGQWPQAALFAVYAGLSIWGFIAWRKS